MRGIKIFGREIKLSQFAQDTTLLNADLETLELALKIVGDFGKIAGLQGVSKVRGHFKKSILHPDFLYFSPFSCRY